jgi:hypothetical protein
MGGDEWHRWREAHPFGGDLSVRFPGGRPMPALPQVPRRCPRAASHQPTARRRPIRAILLAQPRLPHVDRRIWKLRAERARARRAQPIGAAALGRVHYACELRNVTVTHVTCNGREFVFMLILIHTFIEYF